MVDRNDEDLKKMGLDLVSTLEKAIEDGIITREENEDICMKVKKIEEMILHDKIITHTEAAFMRQVQKDLDKYLKGVPKNF